MLHKIIAHLLKLQLKQYTHWVPDHSNYPGDLVLAIRLLLNMESPDILGGDSHVSVP